METLNHILSLSICFISSFIIASLMEYWLHRLMHIFPKFLKFHTNHHLRNTGQGVVGELKDYSLGSLLFLLMIFFVSWGMALSCFLGALFYAIFAAYAHQLQHENPLGCFWMTMPVHYVHHKYNQWHHNFGLGVDWWDHVFRTYKPVEWLTEKEQSMADKGNFAIKWR